MNSIAEWLLERPSVYRLWMAPFAEQKLRPLIEFGDIDRVRRVLDVGCGPGTNAGRFAHAAYTGIDINPEYIASARKRHTGNFIVADVTTYQVEPDQQFDCILVNSLLHHIPTPDARRLLNHLRTLLSPSGAIHIIELVLPTRPSPSRALAKLDRGDYPRPFDEWKTLFSSCFDPLICIPHPIGAPGITLWEMIYFKGRCR
jgi:SAM-dependent methyltransferase